MCAVARVKKPAKHVYHRFDEVIIVEPLIFQRAGYPLSYAETIQRIDDIYGRQVADSLNSLCHPTATMGWPAHLVGVWPGLLNEVLHDMTKAELAHHGYGGRDRTIHAKADERFRGKKGRVIGKRVVKTGRRVPRSSGVCPWDDGGGYEPPYLSNVKSHVILELEVWLEERTAMFASPETIEIEETHVRPHLTQQPGGISLLHIDNTAA